VGQATDQARQKRDLTRSALAEDIDRFERRLRADLDWKARLRREGPQIAAIAGVVVVVVVGGVVLRRTLGGKGGKDAGRAGGRSGSGAEGNGAMSLEELSREVRALRAELGGEKGKSGTSGGSQPLWMKIAIRAASAGAAGGASMLARRYARQAQGTSEGEPVH
jgi:hypothetical protein